MRIFSWAPQQNFGSGIGVVRVFLSHKLGGNIGGDVGRRHERWGDGAVEGTRWGEGGVEEEEEEERGGALVSIPPNDANPGGRCSLIFFQMVIFANNQVENHTKKSLQQLNNKQHQIK